MDRRSLRLLSLVGAALLTAAVLGCDRGRTSNDATPLSTILAPPPTARRPLPAYGGPAAPPVDVADIGAVLTGLTVDEARALAQQSGWVFRVREQDGVEFLLTADLRPDRINVVVAAGRITRVTNIG